jgi:hypothetical protein
MDGGLNREVEVREVRESSVEQSERCEGRKRGCEGDEERFEEETSGWGHCLAVTDCKDNTSSVLTAAGCDSEGVLNAPRILVP